MRTKTKKGEGRKLIKCPFCEKEHPLWLSQIKQGKKYCSKDCLFLSWSEFPGLRYEIYNGITLCHAHHPRRRAEEKRLIPEFQALVAVSKESFCQ